MLRVHYTLKYFENPKIINKNTIQNFGPLAGSTQNRTQKHPLGRTHAFRPTPCSVPPCSGTTLSSTWHECNQAACFATHATRFDVSLCLIILTALTKQELCAALSNTLNKCFWRQRWMQRPVMALRQPLGPSSCGCQIMLVCDGMQKGK